MGGLWILRSVSRRFSCVRCQEEVAALVVDYGSGMSVLVLLVSSHLELCSRRLPAGQHAHAEMCDDASGELFN